MRRASINEGESMLRHTRQVLAAGCLLTVASFSLSCSSTNRHEQEPKASAEPVKDSAPYWCQLIPQQSLRDVISVKGQLKQDRDVNVNDNLSTCEVGTETQLPLDVELALSADAKSEEKEEFATNRSEMTLPEDLGKAIFRSAPEAPNFAISAAFYCNAKPVWIKIVIRSLKTGRDPRADLPAFLRIAEMRYANLAKCQIMTASPTKS
jgi:hypothetical protein